MSIGTAPSLEEVQDALDVADVVVDPPNPC